VVTVSLPGVKVPSPVTTEPSGRVTFTVRVALAAKPLPLIWTVSVGS